MVERPPLRIAFVTIAYWPSVGGSQEHVRRFAEALVRDGHQVEVLVGDAAASARRPSDEVVGSVVVRRHRVPGWLRRSQRTVRAVWMRRPSRGDRRDLSLPWVLAGPLAPSLLVDVVRSLRSCDVVVACCAPWSTLVVPARIRSRSRAGRARVIGLPLLHTSRTAPQRAVRTALRRCDAVVVSTEYEAAAVRRAGVAPADVRILSPGTDPEAVEQMMPSEARRRLGLEDRPTVGYVGRFAGHKGIDTLLAAADLLWAQPDGPTLLLAGAATGWDGVAEAVAARPGEARLVVRSDFSDDERGALLAACDVVVLVSRDESFGLGVIEAWAAGRPTVTSDIPVLRGLVREGIDGRVVALDDPEALARALAELLADGERAQAMGRAGRQRVLDEHRWEQVEQRWTALVDEVAGRTGAVV